MIIKFTILGRLPGMNEIIDACRRNRFAGAAQKKKITRMCAWSIVLFKIPKFNRPVTVHFRWIEPNRRRDRDNIQSGAKFILDALQETGCLINDSRKWVTDVTHEIPEPDPKNPRIEVTVTVAG